MTFDTEGEIIIFIERVAVAADFISFAPFVRIYSSLSSEESCSLRMRNS